MLRPNPTHPTLPVAASRCGRLAVPLFCLTLLCLGAFAAVTPARAAATCPSDAKRSDARVQLWSDSFCAGSTVSVGSGSGVVERPDFATFTDIDGDTTWFDTKATSLAVAADSCVRLFENAGFAGTSYPLVCATAGTKYVEKLEGFDNAASSMRVCSTLMPSDCDGPRPPAPPSPAPAPATNCAVTPTTPGLQLTAGKRGTRGVVTTGARRSPLVGGRLTRADGSPVAGATICVESKGTVPGAVPGIAGTVATDADGRFTYRVARGFSRRLTFVFHGAEGAASDSVLVRVRAPMSLRATDRALRNGQVLGLRGRAPGETGRGLLVEIQARRSSGWQTFATTRTRRNGRFGFAYQFTRTVGVTVYRLRARVPFQPTLPYAPGASRAVSVRVAG